MGAIYVVDLSSYQDPVDFVSVRSAGYVGAILKASEGTGLADSTFVTKARQAVAAGLTIGAYHFGHPTQDPAAEASLFNQVVARASVPVPIRCCDIEVQDGTSTATIEWWTRSFCQLATINLLYSGAYFAQSQLAQPIPGVDWWIASYGTSQRPTPPWGTEAGWQFSDHAYVPGAGNVDVSLFDSDIWAQLTGTPSQEVADMTWPQAVDPFSGGTWTVSPDGGVYTDDGAPYLGSPAGHPEWHTDPPVAVSYWAGDNAPDAGQGYKVTTYCAAHGGLHYYRFPRSGALRP